MCKRMFYLLAWLGKKQKLKSYSFSLKYVAGDGYIQK